MPDRMIILIDDDDDDKQMLDDTIKMLAPGHKILKVENGREGLELLKKLKAEQTLPCLVILDLNMPKMDGKQAFIAIKSDPVLQKIPVIIFSTSSGETDTSFFEKHNTPYFVKPACEKELWKIATEMLSNCRRN